MHDTNEVEVISSDHIEESEGKARLDDHKVPNATPVADSSNDARKLPSLTEYKPDTLPAIDDVVAILGKDKEPVATGRVVSAVNDQVEVRVESSDSDEMGSILGVGQIEERGMVQIRKLDDPTFRFGPDISPRPAPDRPANFPTELLNERTDRLVAGKVDGWAPSQKFEEGLNSSNILSDGNRTIFVKSTSENGISGARTEVDAARMLRNAGIPAPHVERGGHDGILVLSGMAGDGLNVDSALQWVDVFDGFSGKVTLDDLELENEDSLWQLAVMNMVLANADRHGANILVGRSSHTGKAVLLPIDHEIALDSAGGGEQPLPDGSDLFSHLDDLSFAYDFPLSKWAQKVKDRDAVKDNVRTYLENVEQQVRNQEFESESNKQLALARIDAMLANVDAVLRRMWLESD